MINIDYSAATLTKTETFPLASLTRSHTCSGSEKVLLAYVFTNGSINNVATVKYHNVNMAFVRSVNNGTDELQVWSLANPDTGTHDLVASFTNNTHARLGSLSYVGVGSVPTSASFVSSAAPYTITTPTDDCWLVLFKMAALSTAGTGATFRFSDSGNDGRYTVGYDSNGSVGTAGSKSISCSGSNNTGIVIVLSPVSVSGSSSSGSASPSPSPSPSTPPSTEGIEIEELANGFYIEGGQSQRWRMTVTGTTPTIEEISLLNGYDVFLVAGQSNTYAGEEDTGDNNPSATLDSTDSDILQIGRWDGQNNQVILAEEPLDHAGYQGVRPPSDWVGWALAFAKMYKAQGYLATGRKILLVPAGEGGTGLADGAWVKGGTNYNDAIARTNVALSAGNGTNILKGILWHQGEDDCDDTTEANAYQSKLLTMIDDMRTDLGAPNVPFVVGGMVPSWLTTTPRQTVQGILAGIGTQRTYTGYANPSSPTTLTASSIGTDNHFEATSMRGSSQNFNDPSTLGMAGRYWVGFLAALANHP